MPQSRSTSHTSANHDALSPPTQRTPLLHHASSNHSQRNSYHRPSCQQADCEHGALSPHASRPTSSSSTRPPAPRHDSNGYTAIHMGSEYQPQPSDAHHHDSNSFGGKYGGKSDLTHGILGDALADGILGDGTGGHLDGEGDGANEGGGSAKPRWKGSVAGISTTQYLARTHDVKGRRIMYVYHVQSRDVSTGSRAKLLYIQVLGLLFPFLTMDHAIPLALPPR